MSACCRSQRESSLHTLFLRLGGRPATSACARLCLFSCTSAPWTASFSERRCALWLAKCSCACGRAHVCACAKDPKPLWLEGGWHSRSHLKRFVGLANQAFRTGSSRILPHRGYIESWDFCRRQLASGRQRRKATPVLPTIGALSPRWGIRRHRRRSRRRAERTPAAGPRAPRRLAALQGGPTGTGRRGPQRTQRLALSRSVLGSISTSWRKTPISLEMAVQLLDIHPSIGRYSMFRVRAAGGAACLLEFPFTGEVAAPLALPRGSSTGAPFRGRYSRSP